MPAIGNPTKYQDAPYFESVGTGSQTVWTLPWAPGFAGSLIVVVGGVPQPVSAYSVAGNQLTLSAAPLNGARILVFGRGNSVSLMRPASGSVTSTSFDTNGVTLPTGSKNLPGVTGSHKNLRMSASGLSSLISVSADELVLSNGLSYFVVRNINTTSLNLAASGINGLDIGTSSTSTWYSVWAIYNPTSDTVAYILSLSETSPSMPSGFTYKARLGWVRSDTTANKYPLPFTQRGDRVQYSPAVGSNLTGVPIMASGLTGNPVSVWSTVSAAAFVPPSAKVIHLMMRVGNNGAALCAPNSSYGGINDTSKPSPMSLTVTATTHGGVQMGSFLLETFTIYWASDLSTNLLACMGWEDSL